MVTGSSRSFTKLKLIWKIKNIWNEYLWSHYLKSREEFLQNISKENQIGYSWFANINMYLIEFQVNKYFLCYIITFQHV